jgi:hypothetical protein
MSIVTQLRSRGWKLGNDLVVMPIELSPLDRCTIWLQNPENVVGPRLQLAADANGPSRERAARD